MPDDTPLRAAVFEALDNALDGGHFGPGQLLCGSSIADLAIDLLAYDADLGEDLAELEANDAQFALEPHVKAWLEQRGERLNAAAAA